jgi:hypothetical protein
MNTLITSNRAFQPAAGALNWLATFTGTRILRERAAVAAEVLLAPDLSGRLQRELEASHAGGNKVFRIGNSLRVLSEELALLAFACSRGATPASSEEVWRVAARDFLPVIFALDEINFQGRTHDPRWHSDLWTADIGVNLAWTIQFPTPLRTHARKIEELVRTKCVAPILADWIDDPTRWHSLDSMGHNWWAVLVSSAGVMTALLGDHAQTNRIAGKLLEWFHFPGREFSHKRPNFGPEGDYVEGSHYCEYALTGVCLLAHLRPEFRWIPDGLNKIQARGLAEWFKRAYVRTRDGWRIQRFGDISPRDRLRAEVWHALAAATDDAQLLALAHEIKPEPRTLAEFILWEPGVSPPVAFAVPQSLRLFPTSGLAFDFNPAMTVTARAGECWVHNHLDAGTFIFQQEGVVWIDDAGTCAYSHADYLDYYITPAAHNVAYAPALCPPPRRAVYEGLPATGRFLSASHSDSLSIWCADTGIVSGGALARSYRWFLRLGDDGLIVWDDLHARQPQVFEFLLNTPTGPEQSPMGKPVALQQDGLRCALDFFCDAKTEFSLNPVLRGEPDGPNAGKLATCLRWRSAEVERVKFGLALGTGFQTTRWSGSAETGGWECLLQSASDATWRIWFNPLADGRIMHQNCVSRWRNFQTDAYALILREHAGGDSFAAVEASFVRRGSETLFSNLARQTDAVLRSL